MSEESVKVIAHDYEVDGTGIDDIPAQWSQWFECGACEETLIDMDEHVSPMKRCPHCNTPIDWDGWF